MKNINKIQKLILLAIIVMMATIVYAYERTFSGGERLYFNMNAQTWWHSDISVKGDGNFAYFFHSVNGTNAWSKHAMQYSGDIYYVEVPVGTWDRVILTRHSVNTSPDWSNKWNQTDNLWVQGGNYITKFAENSGDCGEWERIVFPPTGTPESQSVTVVIDSICESAADNPYALSVSGETINNYEWFHYTGTAWEKANPLVTKDSDYIHVTLGTIPDYDYYYLQCEPFSSRRLLKIVRAKKCELTCEITSFEMVTSSVNVHDSTYAIDGMVAFGLADGDLKISCDGKDTVYQTPQSPQVFTIKGLRADAQAHVVTAQFMSGAACSISKTITAPSPNSAPVAHTYHRYIGDTITLRPDSRDSTMTYVWSDGCTAHDRGLQFYNDTVVTYQFTDFNKIADVKGSLISNGSFEDDFDYSVNAISDYAFWGKGDALKDYYKTHPGASGGYAIVKDANYFAPSFAKVVAKDGQYFGLFDGGANTSRAWLVTTTQTAPALKLEKGVTYMFSFWVCNINNFSEMNNAAKLKFNIHYNSTDKDLGVPINLNDFRDNLWHQCSSIFVADEDCNDVTISVVDENPSGTTTGNDFGLDDIRFQAISVNTASVHALEQFIVNYHLPEHYTYPYSFCSDSIITLKATANPYEQATQYIWNGPTSKRDTLYKHHIEIDWNKETQPTFYDTLICRSYKDMGVLLGIDTFTLTVDVCQKCIDTLIYRKWNDILFVNNGANDLVSYQWLCNEKPITGATGQFYDTNKDATSMFACIITRKDGTKIRTCGKQFTDFDKSVNYNYTFPTSLKRRQVVSVNLSSELNMVTICDLMGNIVYQANLTDNCQEIIVPDIQGLYIIYLNSTESAAMQTYKVIVE